MFDGSVAISVKIVAPTSQLRLHAKSLAVHKASVQFANGVVAKDLKAELDEKWSILTVQLPSEAQPQDLTLQLDFTGELNDKMNGFYRSSYKDAKGEEKFLASTQFEVFPSFTLELLLEHLCSTSLPMLGRTDLQVDF